MKSCTKCGRSDVVFGKSKKAKDGLRQECNPCRKAYRVRSHERRKLYMAEYYSRNKEKFREHNSDYYLENKVDLNAYCKDYRESQLQEEPEEVIYGRIKRRARLLGIPFNLDISDVEIPEICPVLGIKIVCSGGHPRPDSPSVDRKTPTLGYVKGNVRVISNRANTLKSDATVSEMALVLDDLRRLMC